MKKPTTEALEPTGMKTWVVMVYTGRIDVKAATPQAAIDSVSFACRVIGYVNNKGGVTMIDEVRSA